MSTDSFPLLDAHPRHLKHARHKLRSAGIHIVSRSFAGLCFRWYKNLVLETCTSCLGFAK